MANETLSRRTWLKRGALGGLALAVAPGIAAAAEKVCADPAKMDNSQKGIRESLNYKEISPNKAETCSGCGFFHDKGDGCGECDIFQGPANPMARCDSWTKKG